MPLGDVVAAFTKTINFHVDIEKLTDDFCNKLKKLAHQNRGETKLNVTVDDKEHEMSLFMSSTNLKVDPSTFVKLLEEMPEVSRVTLNGKG